MLPDVRWGRSLCDGNALSHLMCMQCLFIFLPSEPCTLHSLVVRLTLPQALFATSSAYTDNTARPSFDCRPCRYITRRCESPYRHRFTGRLQTDGRATAAHQLHCLHHHEVVKVM